MYLPNKIKEIFKIISRLVGGIFLSVSLLHASSSYAEDNSRMLVRSGSVTVMQGTGQPLKSANLENIAINQESINLKKADNLISPYQIQGSSKISSKNTSHSGISLRSNGSAVSLPSRAKPASNWVRGKLSKPASSSLAIATNQSKELQKLQKNHEDRKASFKNSLEANSAARNSLLLRQSVNNTGGKGKDNE